MVLKEFNFDLKIIDEICTNLVGFEFELHYICTFIHMYHCYKVLICVFLSCYLHYNTEQTHISLFWQGYNLDV